MTHDNLSARLAVRRRDGVLLLLLLRVARAPQTVGEFACLRANQECPACPHLSYLAAAKTSLGKTICN